MSGSALVVQCFNKIDTITSLTDSLLACATRAGFDLIFWADSARGSRNEARYAPACAEVMEFLHAFQAEHAADFASIRIFANDRNLGPYETCRRALDLAFQTHDFAVFTEDDTIFDRDALQWFTTGAETDAFRSERVWAISGESIFFNSRRETVTDTFRAQAIGYARSTGLIDKFVELKFVPSTCFATSAAKWREFGATRGQVNGDVTLCQRCEAESRTCLQPVIARVRDTGMLHDFGYSVSIHTKAGVQEIKNTYVSSNDILDDGDAVGSVAPLRHNAGELFARSTRLGGFDKMIAQPPAGIPMTLMTPTQTESLASPPTAPALPLLGKTLAMIEQYPPGTYVPEETKCFDEDEIRELGHVLSRLVYAPSQIRKKLESHGVSIVPANFYSEIPTQVDLEASFAGRPPSYDAPFRDTEFLEQFLASLTAFSVDFDPPRTASPGEFHWENDSFSYSDAMSYYAMIRKVKPATIIEVGCGWSTNVAQLALERNGSGRIIGIEPYPPEFLVHSPRLTLVKSRAQDLDAAFFNANLASGDILFIDSTHTVKHASDCLHLYLSILPQLAHDLSIHVHDVFLPNTLSLDTMRNSQIYWTEQYLLYAYLLDNPRTRTLYGSAYHHKANRELLDAFMHGRYGAGGGSFWFEQRGRLNAAQSSL